MKKITGIYCIIFCLCLHSMLAAQPGKKPTTKPTTPSMSDIQKMMKDLPAEQQTMIKNAMGKTTANAAEPPSTALDEWNKSIADAAAAIGTVTTKTIGPAGGIIKSVNGKITLNFPAGALATDTPISIEEASNTAPLACGNSFKLTPDGQVFTKPVMLTIKYKDNDIDGTAPEALYMASEVNGVWMASANATINAEAKTVTLPIKHFSDWGMGAFLKMIMLPKGDKELGRGQTMNFRVTTYKEIADKKAKWEEGFLKKLNELVDEMDKEDAAKKRDEELTKQEWKEYVDEASGGDPDLEPLIREAPKTTQRHIDEIGEKKVNELLKKEREVKNQDDDLVPLVLPTVEQVIDERLLELLKNLNKFKGFKLSGWEMNGDAAPVSNQMGKLISDEYGIAEFTAPWVVPLNKIRSIAISCEFINLQSKAKCIFVTHVFLTNNGWMNSKIDGNLWYAHQLLDPKYLAAMPGKNLAQITSTDAQYDEGKTLGQIKSASAHYSDGSMGPKGLILMLTNGFPKAITLRIENPHPGDNIIDCHDDGAALQTEDWAATLTEIIRTASGSECNTTEVCKKLTINFKVLNLKTGGLVEGTYSGSLYGNNFNTPEKACISSIKHKVSGTFSLSVVSPDDYKQMLPKYLPKN